MNVTIERHEYVLPSVTNKKVTVAFVSSTEAFLMVGLALQLEVSTAATSIPGLKVGEECWNFDLDAWLEVMAATWRRWWLILSWRRWWWPRRSLPGYGRPSP
jgi:hypothetical protein